ncbi:hypothetical protein [Planococcus lenghuensis]|uniref:hypothetical protein n=1 Tax=Planococcus lenghuensis TaxID=2213202 RepID=UPI0012EBD989|nr:hypothetical protein [Planococcus lenghuensis]
MAKWVKLRRTKTFFLKLITYNFLGFIVFHSVMHIHGTVGNRFMENAVEDLIFEGDVKAHSREKLAELEQELGYELEYADSQVETDFPTHFGGSGGDYHTEGPVVLTIGFTVDESSCDSKICKGKHTYTIQYGAETYTAESVNIPFQEAVALKGIEGTYQEEPGGNYYYNIHMEESEMYNTGRKYAVHFDELSSSGYWDKEPDNYTIHLDNEFPGFEIEGTISTHSESPLRFLDGRKAQVISEAKRLIVRIPGELDRSYYRMEE